MQANQEFTGLDKSFWAHVRTLSEGVGYTDRGLGTIKVPSLTQMAAALQKQSLRWDHLTTGQWQPTELGHKLHRYFEYRAHVLNSTVQHQLQTAQQAEAMYLRLKAQYPSLRTAVLNKQKGDKAKVAYLTAMVDLLVEAHSAGVGYCHNPTQLTTLTRDGVPLRTLARRVDGAFPAIVNPIAIWEIKEYYHTTTFGSRVADGVYETLLDGLELEETLKSTGIDVQHILIADAHYTWWSCGRSYLCRMIDMLHMGMVDEILFGTEIEHRLPQLVQGWMAEYQRRLVQAQAPSPMLGGSLI